MNGVAGSRLGMRMISSRLYAEAKAFLRWRP